MISPATGYRFGQLLRDARERRGLGQEDIAVALKVDRSLVSQWERGINKRPVSPDDVNRLSKLLDVTVLDLVEALGYDVRLSGIEDEAAAALLGAYLRASDDQRQIAQLALGLGLVLSSGGLLDALRQLAAMGRPEDRGIPG
jgi:transcriptional regulator with XRE-family HTH domain